MPDPTSDAPVLDLLAAMTAESVARCDLDDNSLIAARLAALAAVDAPTASYLVHIGPAMDAGVTIEQVQDILIAVAPIIGTRAHALRRREHHRRARHHDRRARRGPRRRTARRSSPDNRKGL